MGRQYSLPDALYVFWSSISRDVLRYSEKQADGYWEAGRKMPLHWDSQLRGHVFLRRRYLLNRKHPIDLVECYSICSF